MIFTDCISFLCIVVSFSFVQREHGEFYDVRSITVKVNLGETMEQTRLIQQCV
jgi:hypothetical protein